MHFLNARSLELELLYVLPAAYAIVSHRWYDESEEVHFTDIGVPERAQSPAKREGYQKIRGACAQAVEDGLDYVWLDTCCIDRRNSAELTEAINRMYSWYRGATVCYAYLYDVRDPSELVDSEWFTRGWTLQELIAPRVLKFFTEGWELIGTRDQLIGPIAKRTGISSDILRTGEIPRDVTISQKMVWTSERETTRAEDRSYSMLGILGISMVAAYGIGDEAFEDLQHRLILKLPDQTLFAWYHTFTPPGDVEMADAVPVPDLVPSPASELAEDDNFSALPSNTTGLLASSPNHYMKSYEISERDFRRHYVNNVRDVGHYRPHFSVTNNFVRLSLLMKRIAGTLWKAVLRCSFEPPATDRVQRPLVIYLREAESAWRFTRVHLAPAHKDEAMADDGQIANDATKGVPGSLEQLKEEEADMQGFVWQDIDVVGWYGERAAAAASFSPHHSDARPLPPPPSDPHSLPVLTEAERVAHLPRHPPGAKTTNILVCGEPGAGSGRVVNLMLGHTVLKPLSDYARETMAVTVIDATLHHRPERRHHYHDGSKEKERRQHIRILYALGPRDPYMELDRLPGMLRDMHAFVQRVRDAGGIHLVVMCMVGRRASATSTSTSMAAAASGPRPRPLTAVETNFRLFHDGVCQGRVPTLLVVTGLGKTSKAPGGDDGTGRTEDWWDRHRDDPALQSMVTAQSVVGHACITVLGGQGGDGSKREGKRKRSNENERVGEGKAGDDDMQDERFRESQETVQRLVHEQCMVVETEAEMLSDAVSGAYCPADERGWFASLARQAMELLPPGQRRTLQREQVSKMLVEAVGLDVAESDEVVRQLFG